MCYVMSALQLVILQFAINILLPFGKLLLPSIDGFLQCSNPSCKILPISFLPGSKLLPVLLQCGDPGCKVLPIIAGL